MDSSIVHSMEGVLGVKSYVPQSEMVDSFRSRWRKQIMSEYPTLEKAELSIMGLWAYDTFQALAKATEQLGGVKSHFVKTKKEKTSAGVASLGVSSMGPKLLLAILNTQFEGLSGKFRLINGQLQPSMFEIINMVGEGGRRIGYWTPISGLTTVLNKTTKKTPASKEDLDVVSPGKSMELPRGWVIPTSQGRLRIGVPADSGFNDILKVRPRNRSRYVDATGFVIHVFNAVRELLPYSIAYDFLPFGNGGPYNDHVYQVHLHSLFTEENG